MEYLYKQINKNLYGNRIYTVVLFLLVFLSSFMYYFVEWTVDRNSENYNKYISNNKTEDFQFQLTSPDKLMELEQKYSFISESRGIKKVTENDIDYFFRIASQVISMPTIVEGRFPEKTKEIAVYPKFLDNKGLKIGDSIEINGETYTITGSVYLSDYITFIPYKSLRHNYESGTFALVVPEEYENIKGVSDNYYAGKFTDNVPKKDLDERTKAMRKDSSIENLTFKENLLSISELNNSLSSNRTLAFTFLVSMSLITLFAFYMYFKKHFMLYKSEYGTYKALGFRNLQISLILVRFTLILSLFGVLLGMIASYFVSSVLLNNLIKANEVPFIAKGLELKSIFLGCGLLLLLITCLAYFYTRKFLKEETCNLLYNIDKELSNTGIIKISDKVSGWLPESMRMSVRIVLRHPATLLLLCVTTIIVSVFIILGISLYNSSGILLGQQTEGRNYTNDVFYQSEKTESMFSGVEADNLYFRKEVYLSTDKKAEEHYKVMGFRDSNTAFQLFDSDGNQIQISKEQGVVINPVLANLHQIKIGDDIKLALNNIEYNLKVSNISNNGNNDTVYMSLNSMWKLFDVQQDVFNGALLSYLPEGGDYTVETYNSRLEALEENSVSNRSSAVINQVLGIIMGLLLIFLVLLLNFQDNMNDMLTLDMLGYKAHEIRRLLIDIYRPILTIIYIIMLPLSIYISKQIHVMISIGTNDYIPFSTNVWIILLCFLLIQLIYTITLLSFNRKIKQTVANNQVLEN